MPTPLICHAGSACAQNANEAVKRAQALAFNSVCFAPAAEDVGVDAERALSLGELCRKSGLALLFDLDISELPPIHPLVRAHPECFRLSSRANGAFIDPRLPHFTRDCAITRPEANPEAFVSWWVEALCALVLAGVRGFRVEHPDHSPPSLWRELLGRVRAKAPTELTFIANTTGLTREALAMLADVGFDYTLSSLPWWDGRSPWFVQEHEAARRVAPVVGLVEAPGRLAPAASELRKARLALAAVTGHGVLMPLGYEDAAVEDAETMLAACVRSMNALAECVGAAAKSALAMVSGPGEPLSVILRADGPDLRTAEHAFVAILNPAPMVNAKLGPDIQALLAEWSETQPVEGFEADGSDVLPPGGVRLLRARRTKPIVRRSRTPVTDARQAARQPRAVIANVSPCMDGGAFAVKRIVGQTVTVEADIFVEGHGLLAAELKYRAEDESEWRSEEMLALGNDRFRARFPLRRVGRYEFFIEAWPDAYGTFMRDLSSKRGAAQDVSLDLEEGSALIAAAACSAPKAIQAALSALASALKAAEADEAASLLLAPSTKQLMRAADAREFKAITPTILVESERGAAQFSSWYELFPRSQTDDPARHGTFRDVIARLPAIADMGFDVLYMPPIHPIGTTNRKGRNNALNAAPDDPGSTYAIGSREGGHTAIHPQLGTFEDFLALVDAARGHGIEIALDFAIQCSPDHPWLAEHKGWFDWRPDGTVKFAQNPPKKYEDIVNVDFYSKDAVPDLWVALRDIVLFWVDKGVRIFRVDNPHTKPFPFWHWMIRDVRGRHPDVIFLSEAFTRPKVMYHLAKIGFSQSYTYFTWRNTKAELMAYIAEISRPPVADFFRPHFFVNTPDINPVFLQTSGRAGFLIRAALAATLSGLWGLYSGFELCEAEALPGREEYRDSEKYEIKPRNWNAPGNIIGEITELNRLRRSEPCLQTHHNTTFYNAFNDNILYYGRHSPRSAERILVAVSLNPHAEEAADFEIPLWEWGLPDSGAVFVRDLLNETSFIWHGKMQRMNLTPEAPYAVWRVKPAGEER